ncbi:MAG: prepilin-type N-terminal cleavage/methylation domain-containing protein [Planctomycetota bacterium]
MRTWGRPGSREGFTLIELLVVLLILAAVAGIVIPSVAMVGRSTDMAASASNQAELSKNIQQFFLLQKRYPQGLDSLLKNDEGTPGGAPANPDPDGVYRPVGWDAASAMLITDPAAVNTNNQVSGPPRSGPDFWAITEMITLTPGQSRSLTRSGFEYVFDHATYTPASPAGFNNEVDANVSGKYRRALSGSAVVVCAIRDPNGTAVPPDLGTVTDAQIDGWTLPILRQLVPFDFDAAGNYAPEPGTRIVCFGIGPQSNLVPTTMMNAPIYPGADKTYYGRYIAYFKVFDSGERCVLLGVSDSYGRLPDFTQRQFNESMPNRARQG